MNNSLHIERQAGIIVATLNRPKQRNAVNDEIIEGIERLVKELNEDASAKVLIFTGAGSAFCAGGDIKQMQSKQGMFGGNNQQIRDNYRTGIQRIPLALAELDVPSIAAVNGPAVGAGCDLTTMCDIRIASNTASFAESFVKLGLIPGDGGAYLLPRVIGMSRAAEMSLTGDSIDAATALDWGLVSRVVEPDQLMPAALDLAQRIAANPAAAVRAGKRLLTEGQRQSLKSILELSASIQAGLHGTADHEEAIDALLNKRAPQFSS